MVGFNGLFRFEIEKEMDARIERRKFKRVRIDAAGADYQMVDFTFWAQARAKGREHLLNISLGGMSFKSPDDLPNESLLTIKLKVGDFVRIGDLCGPIVRVRNIDTHTYEVGVSFSWWKNDEDKKSLSRVIDIFSPSNSTAGN